MRRRITKRIVLPAVLALAAMSLGACGYSQGDPALSGAAVGAFTDPRTLDLSQTAWR